MTLYPDPKYSPENCDEGVWHTGKPAQPGPWAQPCLYPSPVGSRWQHSPPVLTDTSCTEAQTSSGTAPA